ncbi:glycoside hydrolase family 47 protein, partial [Aplosporella prunicola CBS 121167]
MSKRKLTLVVAAFVVVSLISFNSSSSFQFLYRALPPANVVNDNSQAELLKPSEPDDGKFHWSMALQRYPVSSMTPIPTGRTKMPRIQHTFNAENDKARELRLTRLAAVKDNFTHAWSGYKKYAWLSDEVAPISGAAHNSFGGWAATLVDSLDTLWIMGLKEEFEEAVHAIDQIDFTTCALEDINVFETTIRYLGGFLAAYDLSQGRYPSLLQKATEMGDMLYAAFDTPNRMPITRWNFKAAAEGAPQEAPESALVAEIGSLTLEFTRLSQLTNNPRYYDAIQRIMDVFEVQQNDTKLPGMWPIAVNAKDLDFTDYGGFTIGGMADSLYEYFPKQHMLLGGATEQNRRLFEISAAAMKKHMIYRPMTPGNLDILMPGDISSDGLHIRLDPRNQHLTCFAGGMFAIAGKIFQNKEDVDVGRKLTDGCLWAYETNPHGIMPEIMYTIPCEDGSACRWNEQKWLDEVMQAFKELGGDSRKLVQEKHLQKGISRVADTRYILRPEAIESVFILYRITGDQQYSERAWRMFENIVANTKTDIAHAGLDDCITPNPPKSDRMESFWLAETLKYFYLIFSDPSLVSLDEYVLNTEAHPLKRPT